MKKQENRNELRLGYVLNLYYDCLSAQMPKQLQLLQDWFPSLLIKEMDNPKNEKIDAEYIDHSYEIAACRYNGSLYAGGSRRISQLTGRLIGTAKGNQEKERKTAELLQKHLAREMVNDGEILLKLRDHVFEKFYEMSDEQFDRFIGKLFDFVMKAAQEREDSSEYEIDSEPFPMDDESFEMVIYNAAYQLSLGDDEAVAGAYLWLLLGGLLRNECGRVTRIYDSSFNPLYRQVAENPTLTEKIDFLFYPEDYESVYNGDDFEARFPDVVWRCDHCGEELNRQEGFDDHLPVWQCRKCGWLNPISADQIFENEEDFRNQIRPGDEEDLQKALERRKKELEE